MRIEKTFSVFYIMMDTIQKKLILRMGGIGNFTYTNSREAVLDSIQRHFRFIEIDLVKTSDGHLFAAHDWKHFKSLAGFSNNDKSPMALGEAM